MATTARTTETNSTCLDPKPRRVCFSFAAYAKNVIDHLKNCQIPVIEGLTDVEFSSIEASLGFIFPPDLRSILREGLPVGQGFPNWRSSSAQQLEILINLPILGICKEVSEGNFWCGSWGDEPDNPDEALNLAKQFLKNAPVLVPIYKNCYIPTLPNLAGNPIFFAKGGYLRYSGNDIAGFFQKVEFRHRNSVFWPDNSSNSSSMKAPAWAAKAARRIEFWSDLVESSTCEEGNATCETWKQVLEGYFEEICCRLKVGGWSDEEVKEMMMIDGCDEKKQQRVVLQDSDSVVRHVRVLSLALLRAGWGPKDVLYSLGLQHEAGSPDAVDSWLEFQLANNHFQEIEYV